MRTSLPWRLGYIVLAAVAVVGALAGCGGSGGSGNPFEILLDGFPVATADKANPQVTVRGILEADYLLTVAQQPRPTLGLHTVVHVVPGQSVDLRTINPFQGAVLRGTVRRDDSSGPLLGNTRVVAVKDAAELLDGGSGPLTLPPEVGSGLTCVAGYTDSAGEFVMGPMEYGEYLVTAALPGYASDVTWVRLTSSADGNASLVLTADAGLTTGAVRGTVIARSGATIAEPIITARPATAFEPTITPSTRTRVATNSGHSLPAGSWFAWRSLTGTASTAGVYLMDLPEGTQALDAFKIGWRAQTANVTITAGGLATQDFSLSGL
jgi:hypothetical protein